MLSVVFVFLVTSTCCGSSVFVKPGDGDPAPGRSPGPPLSINPPPQRTDNDATDNSVSGEDCEFDSGSKVRDAEDYVSVTLFNRFFTTDWIVSGIKYQVIVKKTHRAGTVIDFVMTSTLDGIAIGEFPEAVKCGPHSFRTRFISEMTIKDWIIETPQFSGNITFKFAYKLKNDSTVYKSSLIRPLIKDCILSLKKDEAYLIWHTLPHRTTISDCTMTFPNYGSSQGVVVDVLRLNVPCSRGQIHFHHPTTNNNSSSSKQANDVQLCGKLEELSESERSIYFTSTDPPPSLHLSGSPIVFELSYRLVDQCHNVTLTAPNGTVDVQLTSVDHLKCTFKIYMPYGTRVALQLNIVADEDNALIPATSPSTSPSSPLAAAAAVAAVASPQIIEQTKNWSEKSKNNKCEGLLTEALDGTSNTILWSDCTRLDEDNHNHQQQHILHQQQYHKNIVSQRNKMILHVQMSAAAQNHNLKQQNHFLLRSGMHHTTSPSSSSSSSTYKLRITYVAVPIAEIVGECENGWIALDSTVCVSAIEDVKLTWNEAEAECGRRGGGGHLVSVRSQYEQEVVNNLLVNSPVYKETNAYWIGATDRIHEGDFRWSDNRPFSYTNWFPGWDKHGFYNKQPNDDGLSDQDCVELRRIYQLPASSANLAPKFMWNDRDCTMRNFFICGKLLNNEPLDSSWLSECNRSVEMTRQQPRMIITSPGFPRHYPDNAVCRININAPSGYHVILEFDELILENEPTCSYDYLEIRETPPPPTPPSLTVKQPPGNGTKKICGDWSSKLKLLRYISYGSKLMLHFSSDYSHHFEGYKIRVSIENVFQCSEEHLLLFNNFCYLFVGYPEVTWHTAQQTCRGKNGQLASILTLEEERFIRANIRKSNEYRTNSVYWLGAETTSNSQFQRWTDGNEIIYQNWLPNETKKNTTSTQNECISMQWVASFMPTFPSGLYWRRRPCTTVGGYVCKRPHRMKNGEPHNFNRTINGTSGAISTPFHPENYHNNLDFTVQIFGPPRTRIVTKFTRIDIEPQKDCLYDYVELSGGENNAKRWCGIHDQYMQRFNFISMGSSMKIHFHSDYSITDSGFSLVWRAVDVSACPTHTLTAKEGTISSPNYPEFLLPHLSCLYTILAPAGKRIWLEFDEYDVERGDAELELNLGGAERFRPYEIRGLVTEGSFISYRERLQLHLHSGSEPKGTGFRARYRIINNAIEERTVYLSTNSTGTLLHLNYPDIAPAKVDYTQHFIAPNGWTITLELFHMRLLSSGGDSVADECDGDGSRGWFEVYDNYSNGTAWKLCHIEEDEGEQAIIPIAAISITSYFNTIHLRQKNGREKGVGLNGKMLVFEDENYKSKLLKYRDENVESCHPNPCRNQGKCVTNSQRENSCKCIGYYTGIFCSLTKCDMEPCVFGTCELVDSSYKCVCKPNYSGIICDKKRRPCEGNPCESRGQCIERGDRFICRCHAWWEGARCERRMLNIPYKPLSERMFHEPFWLGLMTVFVVMAVIGLVWCAKRHFPEKIEKLLAEDDHHTTSTFSSLRSSSVREQLALAAAASSGSSGLGVGSQGGVAGGPGSSTSRSLFGRLGIRKPSILSLTSPHASGYFVPSTAPRTFSLDDLLKPPKMRTPSPKKKRNNSTPTRKNVSDKKQILQQLISPNASKHSGGRKMELSELMQLQDNTKLTVPPLKIDKDGETKFDIEDALNDPKLEKKVTFARLLNRVSAEMNSAMTSSSGTDLEMGLMHSSRLGCAFARPSSTPPSPNVALRSPNSNSSIQGSNSSFGGSSDICTTAPAALISVVNAVGCDMGATGGRKPASSVDSILAMFKNFGTSIAASGVPSPLSSPTSPQDDEASSTSSIFTSESSLTGGGGASGGQRYTPLLAVNSNTIEVPVMDALSGAQDSGNFLHPPTVLLEIPSTISKCLSPIREMPTPLPSPALTPIMRRSPVFPTKSSSQSTGSGSTGGSASSVGGGNCSGSGACVGGVGSPMISISVDENELSDDRLSIEIPNVSVSEEDEDDRVAHRMQDIIDPHAEDGLLLEEAAVMQQNAKKVRPPRLGLIPTNIVRKQPPTTPPPTTPPPSTSSSFTQQVTPQPPTTPPPPPPLIIPTLVIETPSPTHQTQPPLPLLVISGSPPPQRHNLTTTTTTSDYIAVTGTALGTTPTGRYGRRLHTHNKPASLDMPHLPPMITVTADDDTTTDTDTEQLRTTTIHGGGSGGLGGGGGGMTYLSPFSMLGNARPDHAASESNLSSSGYSSMASPGPSRCGSNNPLFSSSEMEDQGGSGSGGSGVGRTCHHGSQLKANSALASSDGATEGGQGSSTSGDADDGGGAGGGCDNRRRRRSDSETCSDVQESNDDEGIGNDPLDDRIKHGEVKSAKELQVFLGGNKLKSNKEEIGLAKSTNQLQLPSIVVQLEPLSASEGGYGGDLKHISPMSSRSSSPLSERLVGLERFSSKFYGSHKDLLPFTDSDGLYDFPSSDRIHALSSVTQQRKAGKKRDKRYARPVKSKSNGSMNQIQGYLDVPIKTELLHKSPARKLSPKRRGVRNQVVSSSSSSDSVQSPTETKLSSPDSIRWLGHDETHKNSKEGFGEALLAPYSSASKTTSKLSKLRAISHQIRFLRRLEMSLKRKEKLISPPESVCSEDELDSPRASSPLLQPQSSPKPVKIVKSKSIGKLENLLFDRNQKYSPPCDQIEAKRITITGNEFGDK